MGKHQRQSHVLLEFGKPRKNVTEVNKANLKTGSVYDSCNYFPSLKLDTLTQTSDQEQRLDLHWVSACRGDQRSRKP